MPSCLQEAISALFIAFTGRYRLTYEDKALEAEDQLSRLLLQLDRREESLRNTIQQCARDALALRTRDRVRCRLKVQEYKRAQAQLDRLTSYKDMVSVHMDALRNTELNKTLISALQESSKTLKGMGIVDGVRQAEAVVSDVETSMAQAQELSQVLNAPLNANAMNVTVTEAELDAELGLLEDDSPVEMAEIELREEPEPEVAAARPSKVMNPA
jgi:hypothetical protein